MASRRPDISGMSSNIYKRKVAPPHKASTYNDPFVNRATLPLPDIKLNQYNQTKRQTNSNPSPVISLVDCICDDQSSKANIYIWARLNDDTVQIMLVDNELNHQKEWLHTPLTKENDNSWFYVNSNRVHINDMDGKLQEWMECVSVDPLTGILKRTFIQVKNIDNKMTLCDFSIYEPNTSSNF